MAERGRPRRFDRDTALEAAMNLFWERGFEATSLSDLKAAMRINGPSLYAAFGSKEALYLEAVARYVAAEADAAHAVLMGAATAREAILALLRRAASRISRTGAPRGCLVMLGAINGAPENDHISAHLVAQRERARDAIRERIALGVAQGDVSPLADIDALANFYVSVLRGLSLSARDGFDEAALQTVVTLAMAAWDMPLPDPAVAIADERRSGGGANDRPALAASQALIGPG